MLFLTSFIFAGTVCLISQIIMDNTKLTAGHITALMTVIGSILSFLGIYDTLIKWAGPGATVLISNFGHMLYKSGLEGFSEAGFLGLMQNLLSSSSVSLVSVVVFSFIFTLLFKPRD